MPPRIPIKIDLCPINEAVLEIRFKTSAPGEAVFGLIYRVFHDEYPTIEKQPILQIPEPIRAADPNLMYIPEYHLTAENFKLLVGQRVFAVVVTGNYCGWAEFSARINRALTRLRDLEIVDSVSRLGLRYINVFDFNVFSKLTLTLNLNSAPIDSPSTQIIVQIPAENYNQTLMIAHGVEIQSNARRIDESVVDIDTTLTCGLDNFFTNSSALIEKAHTIEKRLFFSLLSNDYLDELRPTFGEDTENVGS